MSSTKGKWEVLSVNDAFQVQTENRVVAALVPETHHSDEASQMSEETPWAKERRRLCING